MACWWRRSPIFTTTAACLPALAGSAGRFKGIALVGPGADERELAALADAGVVGIRFNLSSFGMREFTEAGAERLLAQVREIGWFLQNPLRGRRTAAAMPILPRCRVRVMIDHFGRPDIAHGLDQPGFAALLELGRAERQRVNFPVRSAARAKVTRIMTSIPSSRRPSTPYTLDRCVWARTGPSCGWTNVSDYAPPLACLRRWLRRRRTAAPCCGTRRRGCLASAPCRDQPRSGGEPRASRCPEQQEIGEDDHEHPRHAQDPPSPPGDPCLPGPRGAVRRRPVRPVCAADLKIGMAGAVSAADPHYHLLATNQSVLSHMFEPLVAQDRTQRPGPGLATAWRLVDPTTWEFTLRHGVLFHDGGEFTRRTSSSRAPRAAGAEQPVILRDLSEGHRIGRDRRCLHDPFPYRWPAAEPADQSQPDRHDVQPRASGPAPEGRTTTQLNAGRARSVPVLSLRLLRARRSHGAGA